MGMITDKAELDEFLGTVHHFSSGVYAKQVSLKKGCFVEQHVHSYDHMSILASGVVRLITHPEEREIRAPAVIDIKAGMVHMIVAVEDSVWFCIHPTDCTDPEKVDEVILGKGEA